MADLVSADDEACLAEIRALLGFLPDNCNAPLPRKETGDDPERRLDGIEALVPDDKRQPYDIVKVIKAAVDDGEFLELKRRFARNLVIGFGRLDGYPVGFVANQPMFLAGSLDVDASDKAARFIRFCDAFNIPIVTLMDVPGFFPGKQQEEMGIIRHGAKMLYAYAEATVPKVTIVLRKGYGGAKQAMCTREMGADQLWLWPGVELAVMGGGGAVNVLYRRESRRLRRPRAHPPGKDGRVQRTLQRPLRGPLQTVLPGRHPTRGNPRPPHPHPRPAAPEEGNPPRQETRRDAGVTRRGGARRGGARPADHARGPCIVQARPVSSRPALHRHRPAPASSQARPASSRARPVSSRARPVSSRARPVSSRPAPCIVTGPPPSVIPAEAGIQGWRGGAAPWR